MEGRSKGNREQGLEELNLVEFPLGLLADKRPDGLKTLVFRDSIEDAESKQTVIREVTVTGADRWGLPNWQDVDILLALMKLTNDRHGFKERMVKFTLYELRELLQWPNSGAYKQRLKDGLLRLLGVTVAYERAWRKNGRWVSVEAFHLLDNVRLTNTVLGFDPDEEQHFKWNDVIVESVQKSHTKGLDWPFYLSLKYASSKRLYRFLDKRFNLRPWWRFDLGVLCYEKLGMSRNSPLRECKRQLGKAITELEANGFLKSEEARYLRESRGAYRVEFRKGKSGAKEATKKSGPDELLAMALASRGVTNATELVANFPGDRIGAQIENFDDRLRNGEELSAGWLRMAIESEPGYGFRKGYVSQEERDQRARELHEKRAREKAAADAAKAHELQAASIESAEFEAFLEELGSDEAREAFANEAIQSDPFYRRQFTRTRVDAPERAAEYRHMAMKVHWKKRAGDSPPQMTR